MSVIKEETLKEYFELLKFPTVGADPMHLRDCVNCAMWLKNWLGENNIAYDKVLFSKGSNENKSQEIIENKIDLMIEDNPNNINELSKLVPVICYNTEYNKQCNSDKIFRCYSWYDIYNKINKL
jgi:uncharacterized HAD superfamily protein